MAGDYSFGSQMGDDDGPHADTLSSLLTYGADSDEETPGQPNSAPNVKSDASAPIAPTAHVQAVIGRAMSDGAPAASSSAAGEGGGSSLARPLVSLPVAPTPDLATRQKLTDQLATDQKPTVVAPKWWERALGGLVAGAAGFGKEPGALEAGQAVTNRGQIAEEQQRAGKVAADQTAIDAWNDGQKQQQQAFQDQHTAFEDKDRADQRAQLNSDRAAQESQRLQGIAPGSETPDDPKNPLGTWHATTVGGKQVALQGPPDKWTNSAEGKGVIETQRRKDLVTNNNLTGDDAKYVMVNGKLKEPGTSIHVPSAESEALSEAKAAWKRDNPGKNPTLADFATIRAAASGRQEPGAKRGTPAQFAALDKQTQADYKKAQADYKTANDGAVDNQARKDASDALAAENNRIGAEHSQRLRDLGGIPAEDSQTASSSSASNGPQAARAPAVPKAGDVVRGYKFNGGDPSDKANWKKV